MKDYDLYHPTYEALLCFYSCIFICVTSSLVFASYYARTQPSIKRLRFLSSFHVRGTP